MTAGTHILASVVGVYAWFWFQRALHTGVAMCAACPKQAHPWLLTSLPRAGTKGVHTTDRHRTTAGIGTGVGHPLLRRTTAALMVVAVR
jgi:hypothetical protein